MRISDLITPASISVRVNIENKRAALRYAAGALGSRSGLGVERIQEALTAREELGSTGIGKGVALPHVSFPDLHQPYALFYSLAKPIAFDAIDDAPVDLLCAIISPAKPDPGENSSLSLLAAVARILRDKERAMALREAKDPWSMYDIIQKAAEAPPPALN
jgi:PTS system nitrogen regulatory IIA component